MWGICGKSEIQHVVAFIVACAATPTLKGEESRIEGGQVPPPGKYPAIARLVVLDERLNLTTCVLGILTRDWLVGPAQCVQWPTGRVAVDILVVVVGDEIDNETEPYERNHKVERSPITDSTNKRAYNIQTGDDIAVFKVTPPIMFSNRVTAANLPTCKEPESGIGLIAGYGWGPDLQRKHRLTEITNQIISKEECSRLLNTPVDDRGFCVLPIHNMSTCLFDNGAHMVQVGFMMTWPQKGGCQNGTGAEHVATFVKLSSYVGWIHRRIISGCVNHAWRDDDADHDGRKIMPPS